MKAFFLFTSLFIHLASAGQSARGVSEGGVDSVKRRPVNVTRSVSLLTGFCAGKYFFADIGIARNLFTQTGHHPFSSTTFISCEIRNSSQMIFAPKIGAWVAGGAGGMAMGINLLYYMQSGNSSLVFRPEIGFGFENLKMVYGYNARLTNRSFGYLLNRNLFSMVYCFKLKKKVTKEYR
ncbi:MAG: hypothetical protein QM791_00920 [Ferruginibacter sp.]